MRHLFRTLEPEEVQLEDDHKGGIWIKRQAHVLGYGNGGPPKLSDALSDPDVSQFDQQLVTVLKQGRGIAAGSEKIRQRRWIRSAR